MNRLPGQRFSDQIAADREFDDHSGTREKGVVMRVAVPVPVRALFDYGHDVMLAAGTRVQVPFGHRVLTGMVVAPAVTTTSAVPLRPITAVLDAVPILTPDHVAFLITIADYYHHPPGEVLFAALPGGLRHGHTVAPPVVYVRTAAGATFDPAAFGRATRKRRLWAALAAGPLTAVALATLGRGWRPLLADLIAAGLVAAVPAAPPPVALRGPPLRDDQQAAYRAVQAQFGRFAPFLLLGVTGSGKTEVYLRLIADVLAAGRQTLLLVPEIGLTPQLVARFATALGQSPAVLHSGCTPTERARVWMAAATGAAGVVIGTRSAVFVPLKHPGLVVVDEEHDGSFKQQDGLRYHARDIAVLRAQREQLPVVLGSATPSLESYRHAVEGHYQLLRLPARGGHRRLPAVHLVDLGASPAADGLSPALLAATRACLARGEQALFFLNRRGYAPVLLCPQCRWHAPCTRCDARLTVHGVPQRLRCHHCGLDQPLPATCPQCGHGRLLRVGEGTQRVEAALARQLPKARIARVDRDTMDSRLAFAELLTRIATGDIDILVGTQMLAKGHDFPRITLVAVLNGDQGLYGSDFRADEQIFAQLVQVSGRAGRAERPGEVLIQTHHPTHPLWVPVQALDYEAFAQAALVDRRLTGFPPYGYCALVRAEALRPEVAANFLQVTQGLLAPSPGLTVGAILPATMARRAGYYRAQFLLTAARRGVLHAWLREWLPQVDALPAKSRVRWSVDVDPYSLF